MKSNLKALIPLIVFFLSPLSCGLELNKKDEDTRKKERNILIEGIADIQRKNAFDLTSQEDSCSAARSVRDDHRIEDLKIESCVLSNEKLYVDLARNGFTFNAVFDMKGEISLIPYLKEQSREFKESFEEFVGILEFRIQGSIKYPVSKQ